MIWLAGLVAAYVLFTLMTLGLGVTAKRADRIQRTAFERWMAQRRAQEEREAARVFAESARRRAA